MIKSVLLAFLSLTLLFGCESLKLRNMGKSGASTAIAYVAGGTIPAIGVLTASMAYDELIPSEPSVESIESTEQATAYIAESLFMNLLYGVIAYLVITLIAVPFISRYGYNKAKAKYGRRKDDEQN
jgi:hypothetical protein